MKLSNITPQVKTDKVEVKRSAPTGSSSTATTAPAGDRVDLTVNSAEVQKMREILAETPEVRQDRVRAIKEQIERGEYQVDPYKLADKLLRDLLQESF